MFSSPNNIYLLVLQKEKKLNFFYINQISMRSFLCLCIMHKNTKTLSFKIDDTPILIVVAGQAKIDNKKYKGYFSKKAKMLNKDEALEFTGHAIGGVCPFGLKQPMDVYLDISLKKHTEVIPAAGDKYSSIRLTIDELEKYSNCKAWIDVCKY